MFSLLFTDSESQFRGQMWVGIYRPAGKVRVQLKRNWEEFYRSLGTLSGGTSGLERTLTHTLRYLQSPNQWAIPSVVNI